MHRTSFENIQNWYDKIKEVRNGSFNVSLIANKIDLKESRVISSEEGFELADRLSAFYIETSCFNHVTVEEGMTIAFKNIFTQKLKQNEIKRRSSVRLRQSRNSVNQNSEDK